MEAVDLYCLSSLLSIIHEHVYCMHFAQAAFQWINILCLLLSFDFGDLVLILQI